MALETACSRTPRLNVPVPAESRRRRSMNEQQSQDLKELLLQTGRGVSPARRQASRTRQSPARAPRQALPLPARASRRSHPEEAQAAAQGPDGGHPPAPSTASAVRRPRRPQRAARLRLRPARFAIGSSRGDRARDASRAAAHKRRNHGALPRRFRRLAVRRRRAGRRCDGRLPRRLASALPVRRARRLLSVLLPRSRAASVDRPHAVLSPADGRVMVAGAAIAAAAPPGRWKQVSIFLSPMDVHVNRVPASGRVTRATYSPGRSCRPIGDEAGAANERSEIWIDAAGRWLWHARSSASWRAAWCAGRRGRHGAGGRSLRDHEVRLAHGRVRARDRRDLRARGPAGPGAVKRSSRVLH